MSKIKVDLVSSISICFSTLKYCGQWKPDSNNKKIQRLYNIYGVLINVMFLFLYIMSQLINIINLRHDLEKVVDASFLFITHVSETIKFSQIYLYQSQLQELIDVLKHPMFQPRTECQANIARDGIASVKFLFVMFLGLSIGTITMWTVLPLVQTEEEWLLPLSSWFPFRTDKPGTYHLAYVYQITCSIFTACTNVSMDICVSGFMIMIRVQLDMLNDTLSNIKEFAMERINKRYKVALKFSEENNEMLSEELEKEMNLVLVECVNHHWLILSFVRKFGSIFELVVLNVFAVGVIITCVTMFELTLVEPFSAQFFSMVMYQLCMLLEILFYCWFGNEIILKSSDICSSIYNSDWYRSSVAYRKKLLILMTRVQVPIRIYAGNLFILSLVTFAAILRTSWSYFAVLRSVHSEN